MRPVNPIKVIGDGSDVTFNHPDGFSFTLHGGDYKVGCTIDVRTEGVTYENCEGGMVFRNWAGHSSTYAKSGRIEKIERETIEI